MKYCDVVDEIINSGTDISKLRLSVASRNQVGNLIHI